MLAVVREERLQHNALRTGEYLLEQLRSLQPEHPFLGDVRGMGLMVGIECVTDASTKRAAPHMAHYIRVRGSFTCLTDSILMYSHNMISYICVISHISVMCVIMGSYVHSVGKVDDLIERSDAIGWTSMKQLLLIPQSVVWA